MRYQIGDEVAIDFKGRVKKVSEERVLCKDNTFKTIIVYTVKMDKDIYLQCDAVESMITPMETPSSNLDTV